MSTLGQLLKLEKILTKACCFAAQLIVILADTSFLCI